MLTGQVDIPVLHVYPIHPTTKPKGANPHGKDKTGENRKHRGRNHAVKERQKQHQQQHNQQERKDRTKRLCRSMGQFESMLPDIIPLTDEQSKSFLEKTVTTEHSRRILDGLTAQNAATAPPEAPQAVARDNPPAPTAKTAGAAQESGTGAGASEGTAQG